jgi:hypothetical protein
MGELHRSTVKLQEVMVWLEKGGASCPWRRAGDTAEWFGGCRGERKPKR